MVYIWELETSKKWIGIKVSSPFPFMCFGIAGGKEYSWPQHHLFLTGWSEAGVQHKSTVALTGNADSYLVLILVLSSVDHKHISIT